MPDEKLTGLKRVKPGLGNTYIILDKKPEKDQIQSIFQNLDLLATLDIFNWIPIRRITEVIHCFKEKNYKKDEMIINEGDEAEEFYIMKTGVIKIYSDKVENKFSKLCYTGDYFGESCLYSKSKRLANIQCLSDTICLVINSYDFQWIFDFQNQNPRLTLSPLTLINNLSKIRQKKLAEFINQNQTIEKMTENETCMVNMLIDEVDFKKGHYIWKRGDKTDFCFFIKKGKIKMIAPINKVPINCSLVPGTLIGDFPNLLRDEKSKTSVLCETDCSVFKFSKQNLESFLAQYPAFYLQIKNNYVIY